MKKEKITDDCFRFSFIWKWILVGFVLVFRKYSSSFLGKLVLFFSISVFKWNCRRYLSLSVFPLFPLLYLCIISRTFFEILEFAPSLRMKNKQKKEPISRFLLGCGGLTRTSDLWVMSPTSYHCSTPRSRVNHISCDYGCKGRGFVFNVQAFHCKKSIIGLLLNFIHKAGAVL